MTTALAAQVLPPPVTHGITAGARRLLFLSALLLVPATVGGWFFGGVAMVAGVGVGGVIALINFWLLSRMVVKSTAGVASSPGAMLAQLMFKFGLLGLLLATAIFAFAINGVGLLLGLSVTFAAVPLNLFSEWAADTRAQRSE